MKTLVSIVAVAVVVVAVTMGSVSDAQLLSNGQMSSFVGACCKESGNSGPNCNTICYDIGSNTSMMPLLDSKSKICLEGAPDGCAMTGNMTCASDILKCDHWDGNNECADFPDRSNVKCGVARSQPLAEGDVCN